MKAVVICGFDTYEPRAHLVKKYFEKIGFEVSLIFSNFRHTSKKFRSNSEQISSTTFIETNQYTKNLSISRLVSHYIFAKKAFKRVRNEEPDLIYVMIPPNSLAKQSRIYRKNHKNVKIIFDLMDLWPETMPMSRFESNPVFSVWRGLRDKNLSCANLILTECDLYRHVLTKQLYGLNVATLHLAKNDPLFPLIQVREVDTLHLCYLGSINNIIDIPAICLLVNAIQNLKPVTVHIIGAGESCSLFIDSLEKSGAKVIYEGVVYAPIDKQAIFDRCHFGLNIMKESTVVGLTIKSIDYFHAGLPLINSIPSDTQKLILEKNAGFQYDRDNVESLARTICELTRDDIQKMRENAREVFSKQFSIDAFEENFQAALDQVK